jgi:tetratricopeptide (TPR) repeat protein
LYRSAGRKAVASLEEARGALEHLPRSFSTIEKAIDLRLDLQAALNLQQVDTARKIDSLREAQSLAEALGDQGRIGRVSAQMAHYYYLTGRPDQGVEVAERALRMASALGDQPLEILSTYHLGQAFYLLGWYGRAMALFRRIIHMLGSERLRPYPGLATPPAVPREASWPSASRRSVPSPRHELLPRKAHLAGAVDHTFGRVFSYQALGSVHLAQENIHEAVLARAQSCPHPETERHGHVPRRHRATGAVSRPD